ncbi:MAG: phosphatidylinositol mannoside acyltransferase [Acidimicrobiia bacterium]
MNFEVRSRASAGNRRLGKVELRPLRTKDRLVLGDSAPAGPWEAFRKFEAGPWIAYGWARIGEFLARVLPESLAPPLLWALQTAYSRMSKRRMLMMRRHLEKVLGPMPARELEQRMQRATALYARYWYETFRLSSMPSSEVVELLETEGEEWIAESLQKGKGVILALPHLGNWDMAGCYVSHRYGPVLAIAEYLRPRKAFEHWKRTRERLGMRIVPLDGTSLSVKEAIKQLKSGGIVALVADRQIGPGGIPVEFFGEITRVPAGPAALALRTGADLLPVGLYMIEGGRHRGVVRPPIGPSQGSSVQEKIVETTTSLIREFEELIRNDPEQWHLFTPFWPSDWEALGVQAPS